MLGISHLLISGTAASLLLQTADPVLIAVGAIAGLLPDVDVSTSFNILTFFNQNLLF
jgi:inner membrane protein